MEDLLTLPRTNSRVFLGISCKIYYFGIDGYSNEKNEDVFNDFKDKEGGWKKLSA